MTTNNLTLYRLLVKFGATAAEAETAANFDASALATKADLLELKTDLLALEARLAWKISTLVISAMVGLTAIFAIIVGWFLRP